MRIRREKAGNLASIKLNHRTVSECKGETMIAEIACVESMVENEIKQGCTQKQIAQTYALGIKSSWPTDWAKVNAMIAARWPKGLERVKQLAWSGKCFAKEKKP